jgi:hypothetical protein
MTRVEQITVRRTAAQQATIDRLEQSGWTFDRQYTLGVRLIVRMSSDNGGRLAVYHNGTIVNHVS